MLLIRRFWCTGVVGSASVPPFFHSDLGISSRISFRISSHHRTNLTLTENPIVFPTPIIGFGNYRLRTCAQPLSANTKQACPIWMKLRGSRQVSCLRGRLGINRLEPITPPHICGTHMWDAYPCDMRPSEWRNRLSVTLASCSHVSKMSSALRT